MRMVSPGAMLVSDTNKKMGELWDSYWGGSATAKGAP
jgi:hypothetical protein